DDILFQVRHNTGNMILELTDADIHNRALHHLQTILNRHGKRLDKFPNMPLSTAFFNNEQNNHLINKKQQYDIEELTKLIENDLPRLNMDQRATYLSVIAAVEAGISSVYFIDGP
ncbi:7295_t:CDS:1, partial [Gigaspora rosea]